MRKRHVTVKATEVKPGDRFVLGNNIIRVGLTGRCLNEFNVEYVLIAGGLDTDPSGKKNFTELEVPADSTFDILRK